jgi:hypothetical protein
MDHGRGQFLIEPYPSSYRGKRVSPPLSLTGEEYDASRLFSVPSPGEIGGLFDQGTRLGDAVQLRIDSGNTFGACCSCESLISGHTDKLIVALS